MARIDVPMPQMGESIAEGTVSVWLKKVGDQVGRDEPIMEISTDKVDAEIPSPAAGILAEIVVGEGETVEVGTTVAYIETDAAAFARLGDDSADPDAAPVAGDAAAAVADRAPAGSAASGPRDDESPTNAPSATGMETAEERLRRRSTPLVRRIAAEHGLSVEDVPGTGRAGRVTKEDVLRFVADRRDGRGRRTGAGAGEGDFHKDVVHPEVEKRPGDRLEPMTRMTSLIADHMILSRRISAHVHSYIEVDYSRVDQYRAQNAGAWKDQGVKVTYTAFIARAVAQALREHPIINASVSGRSILYRGQVNLGVAVALEQGLIVPVIRRADELSLVGIARAINDVARRARAKKLSPEEVQEGTFTITNPGIFGTVLGFPIINQPQVAIMAVGTVEKRPVVITDEYGHDAIVARKRGYMALGFDHRVVNGADADLFLSAVKRNLENFSDGI